VEIVALKESLKQTEQELKHKNGEYEKLMQEKLKAE